MVLQGRTPSNTPCSAASPHTNLFHRAMYQSLHASCTSTLSLLAQLHDLILYLVGLELAEERQQPLEHPQCWFGRLEPPPHQFLAPRKGLLLLSPGAQAESRVFLVLTTVTVTTSCTLSLTSTLAGYYCVGISRHTVSLTPGYSRTTRSRLPLDSTDEVNDVTDSASQP